MRAIQRFYSASITKMDTVGQQTFGHVIVGLERKAVLANKAWVWRVNEVGSFARELAIGSLSRLIELKRQTCFPWV